ncbi:hypothetical protein Hdeb2414_s0023g00623311 [Helianthus debilis subsp. tardiflorus]
MVRTKDKAGASSSKGKQPEKQPKKRRYLGRDDDSEEEEEIELDPADKPKWETGPLDDQPKEWQPTLFNDRMNRFKDKAAAFICEREVREVEFGPFNVFYKFRALGWEATLNCYDKDNKNLFMNEIQEWMANRFPFRYLVMNNVWICRNKVGRNIIPYCRMITRLLKLFKTISPEDKGAPKRHKPFDIWRMGVGWTYDESERYHKLKSEGQRWPTLKFDAGALLPGKEDEPGSEDEPRSGDEDYAGEPHGEHMNGDQGGPSRGKKSLKINIHRHRYLIHGRGPSARSLIIKHG